MTTLFDNAAPRAQQPSPQPGIELERYPAPIYFNPDYKSADKLQGKVAIITGGDSGIGRAVAITFAQERAKIVIVYLTENEDAELVKQEVKKFTTDVLLIRGDLNDPDFCDEVVMRTINYFGSIDILVNCAGEQHPQVRIEDISNEQLHHTFATNIFSMYYLMKAALPHMGKGSTIINTTSVTAYQGHKNLIDYSSTNGAITAFTRSLALSLAERKIRVNGVAPGAIWTAIIPSTLSTEQIGKFGKDLPMGRPGQPAELAPAFVYLGCEDSSYMTGQILHINGGSIVNG